MANRLTGDFDAVLEVSDATLDRLAAAMHQNGFPHPTLPSLPHVIHLRLVGDEHGSVAAQVGCPHITLIDGATDRIKVEFGFRARFRADPGSPPLADIIHGTVRATYRIQKIDPTCVGWRGIADDYVWLRVMHGSVSFEGTAYNETRSFQLDRLADQDQASLNTRITKHLAALLVHAFAPRPHRIPRQFRRFRSVATGPWPGGSGVAFPVSIGGGEPTGALASIDELFLDGHDFAVAINSDLIVGAIASELEAVAGDQRDFHIHGDAGYGGGLEIDYHVRVDSTAVQWIGAAPFGMQMGIIRITLNGHGWASRLYRSGVFNIGSVSLADIAMTASVEQYLALQFDAPGQFSLRAVGGPITNVHYTGPFASHVVPEAQKRISDQVQAIVNSKLGTAQSAVASYADAGKLADLVGALRTVDPSFGAEFDRASYRPEGIVLHGTVTTASRWSPHVEFAKTETGDGFDAVESWIPGGRVDSFEWSWRWYSNPVVAPPGAPGTATNKDTFQLRRPHDSRSKFGQMVGVESPLPGLDGLGRVCLTIRGARVDHVTGRWTAVESLAECASFGYQFRLPIETAPYLRVCDPLRAVEGVAPEVGVMRLSAAEADRASNTLIAYVGEHHWDPEAAATVLAGLEHCQRRDAGLLVLVLFGERALETSSAETIAHVQRFAESSSAPVLITDDVGGRWAQHAGVGNSAAGPQWRLLDAGGVVRWAPENRFSAEELARVLDRALLPSAVPDLVDIRPGPAVGSRFVPDLSIERCPPIPLNRSGFRPTRVLFADTGVASKRAIDGLARQTTPDQELIAILVRDASDDDLSSIAAMFDGNVPVFPDPDGTATFRAGIRWAPSIVGLNSGGHVTEIVTDAAPTRRPDSTD